MVLWSDAFDQVDTSNMGGIWFEPVIYFLAGYSADFNSGVLTMPDASSAPRPAMVDSDLGAYIGDQYAQLTFLDVVPPDFPATLHPVIGGLSIRNQPFSFPYGSGYGLAFQHDGTSWVGWFMTRYFQSGSEYTYSSLASGSEHPVNGDRVRFEAQGTTLRWLLNDVVKATVTDSNIPKGCPGVYGGHVTTSGTMAMVWTNFVGGDYAAAPAVPPTGGSVVLPRPKIHPRSYGPFRLRHEFHPRRKAIAAGMQHRQEIADRGLIPVRYGYQSQEKPTRTRRDAIYRGMEQR